ncbi:hypothetical protein F4813DRAFT_88267 [Daldinia decipiens]|uniref:uncharacterized protein n=1 Tax=Daldinia decipiens TaxID=326647 RepID=UPI0020C2C6D0|nr:uncharacterized protein F4813DRAFT_88267 [Daldinia decipiens]KAI1657010.1 hypothetical protein F4813DRAFT_88267 [Daldinia decipiens]
MSQNDNILERSRKVKILFIDLKSRLEDDTSGVPSQVCPEAIEDALDRFLLWSGNLGALHLPENKLSLDYRVRAAPEIRDQICEFLDDLRLSIEELTEASILSTLNLESLGLSDDTTELGSKDATSYTLKQVSSYEAQSLLEEISQCIRSLFRVGVLIRKAVPRDRFQEALRRSDSMFPPAFDIDYAKNKHPKLCKNDMEWLAERIGKANAQRRQYIQYCRDHRTRLGNIPDETDRGSDTNREDAESKATTMFPIEGPELEEETISLTTASTMFDSKNCLKLPTLDKLSPELESFECPICFTLQSFTAETAWKAHAFSDLKGYVCTVGRSSCEDELFSSRNTWFEHELKNHRSKYTCPVCRTEVDGVASLKSHLESIHCNFSAEQISRLTEAGRQTPTRFKAQDCPFCDEWAEGLKEKGRIKNRSNSQIDDNSLVSMSRFKRHIATHQEQLAIFVIPRSDEGVDQSSTSSSKRDELVAPEAPTDIVSEVSEDLALPVTEGTHTSYGRSIDIRTGWEGGGGGGGGISELRWKCCECAFTGMNSTVYNEFCLHCGHLRCSSCNTWRPR